jgi:hypothetical protein
MLETPPLEGRGWWSYCWQIMRNISLVDNAKVLEDYKTKTRDREEAKITVAVQNLVEEMMDIVECREKGEE